MYISSILKIYQWVLIPPTIKENTAKGVFPPKLNSAVEVNQASISFCVLDWFPKINFRKPALPF